MARSVSKTSTVPSNKWSPDHKTPILLTSSAIVRASGRKNVPIMVGVVDYTYHHNRRGRPATLISECTYICAVLGRILRSVGFEIQSKSYYKERGSWLTSNLSMNSLIPSLSPVKYLGWAAMMCCWKRNEENREILMEEKGKAQRSETHIHGFAHISFKKCLSITSSPRAKPQWYRMLSDRWKRYS